MKTRLEKVYSKLPKRVSLNKIELGKIDEVKMESQEAENLADLSFETIGNVLAEIEKARAYMQEAVDIGTNGFKNAEEIERLADELGVDLDSEIVDTVQKLYNLTEGYGPQILKDLENAKNSF